MAKGKAKAKVVSADPVRIDNLTMDMEGGKPIAFRQWTRQLVEDSATMLMLLKTEVTEVHGDDVLYLQALFGDGLKFVADQGIAWVKELAGAVIKYNGDVPHESADGKITSSVVAESVSRSYGDDTLALLEDAGVLREAVTVHATLKDGANLSDVSDEFFEQLKEVFDVELIPDPARLDALVTLDKLEADKLAATAVENVTRKGYTRMSIKPSQKLSNFVMGGAPANPTT